MGFTFHCLWDFYQRHESRYKIYLHKTIFLTGCVYHEGNRTALHVIGLLKIFLESQIILLITFAFFFFLVLILLYTTCRRSGSNPCHTSDCWTKTFLKEASKPNLIILLNTIILGLFILDTWFLVLDMYVCQSLRLRFCNRWN